MKITFDVKNQIITRTDRNQVISNSGDYLEAEISFSADWTGLEKTMTFKNGDELYTIVLANDKILQENHLNLGVGTWKASIIGIAGDQKIVTNECNVSVNSSGWIGSESIPPESVWNQLLVIIQSLHTEAASTAVVRSAVQKYIEDNYDSLVKEYIIIGNVREIIEELVQDGTISDLIAPFVTQELPGVVTTQLPGVVTSQLPAVVTSQLPSVVSSQLPAVAASAAAAEVGTWLTAHVDPDTGYVIDNTLTVSLAAADAKTVGDKVTAIKSALSENTSAIGDVINCTNVDLLGAVNWSLGVLNNSTGLPDTTDNTRIMTLEFINVSKFDFLNITIGTGYKYKLYWYYADKSYKGTDIWQTSNSGCNVPSGAEYVKILVADVNNGTASVSYSNQITVFVTNVSSQKIQELTKALYASTGNKPIEMTNGAYYDLSGASVTIGTPTQNILKKYALVPCVYGDVFTISGTGGSAGQPWGFIDSIGTILAKEGNTSNKTVTNKIVTAPENTAYLIVNNDKAETSISYFGKYLIDVVAEQKYADYALYGYVASGGQWQWNKNSYTCDLIIPNRDVVLKGTRIPNSIAISYNDIIAALESSTLVTVSDSVVKGNSFSITYNISTQTVGVHANSGYLPNNEILLFAHHWNSGNWGIMAHDGEYEGINPVWQSYIAQKAESVEMNMQSIGKNGISFMFISDVHIENNDRYAHVLLNYIKENTEMKYLVSGGDYVTQRTDTALLMKEMRECIHEFRESSRCFLPIIGNHDRNTNFTPAEYQTYEMTENEAYVCMHSLLPDSVVYGNRFYYYYDDTITKTRFILLDSGFEYYASALSIGTEQLLWAKDVMDNTPNGYHIIVFVHAIYQPSDWSLLTPVYNPDYLSTDGETLFSEVDSHNTSYPNTPVVAIFSGHLHIDMSTTTDGGVPVIWIDCDARNSGTHEYEADTTKSQCMDCVTIDYVNKTIKCLRIGRGADRTFTYS